MLIAIATAIAGKVSADAVAPLVRDVAGLQDAQLEQLEATHRDVKALVGAPARAARLFLDEAAQAPSKARRMHYLNCAQQKLVEAHGVQPKPTAARAAVDAELAVVFGLLGERPAAARWACAAYEDHVAAVAADIGSVQRKLNFPLGVVKEDADFWRHIKRARAAAPHAADRALSRWPSSIPAFSATQPELNALSMRVTYALRYTRSGRNLSDLEKMAREADSYHAAATLLHAASLPIGAEVHRLVVDLSQNRKARITWEPVPSGHS